IDGEISAILLFINSRPLLGFLRSYFRAFRQKWQSGRQKVGVRRREARWPDKLTLELRTQFTGTWKGSKGFVAGNEASRSATEPGSLRCLLGASHAIL